MQRSRRLTRFRPMWPLRLPLLAPALLWAAITAPASGADAAPATAPSTALTSPATLPSAADTLIQGLASSDDHVRRHSQEALVRLGEEARPALQAFLQHTTELDASTRAQAALAQIDEDRVTGPSYLTLHFKDAAPREVIAELSRQAFTEMRPFPDTLLDEPLPRVTLDVDHQPYWVAMRQFTEQTGLALRPYIDGSRLMRGNDIAGGISLVRGPFLIIANQVSRNQIIGLGRHGLRHADFMVTLAAFAEPKLVVLGGAAPVEVQQAEDDKGNSLVPTPEESRPLWGGGGGNGNWNLMLRLHWPDNPGQRISRLVGRTSFVVQTQSEKLEIPNITKAHEQTRTLGGSTVVFHGMTRLPDAWEMKLALNNNAPLLQQIFQTQMQVRDDQDHLMTRRIVSGQGDGTTMTYTMQFLGARPPSRLTWEVPTQTKPLPVVFEFDDLPMPR